MEIRGRWKRCTPAFPVIREKNDEESDGGVTRCINHSGGSRERHGANRGDGVAEKHWGTSREVQSASQEMRLGTGTPRAKLWQGLGAQAESAWTGGPSKVGQGHEALLVPAG